MTCYRQNLTVQKKPKSPKDNGQLSDMLTLEGSGRRRNDTRPALRVSLKTLGIPVQTSYVEGQWHQTWAYTSPKLFFCRRTRKSVKNGIILLFGPLFGNNRDIGMGHKRLNDGCAYWTKRLFGKNWLRGSFDHVLVAWSWLRATKCDLLAKIREEVI